MSRGSDPTKVAEWSDRLERFASSGQSVTQFCVAEDVSQPSFFQWRKRLAGNGRVRGVRPKRNGTPSRAKSAVGKGQSKSAFASVQLTTTPGLQQNTMIRLTGGVEIELGNNLRVVETVVRCVVEQSLANVAARAGGASC